MYPRSAGYMPVHLFPGVNRYMSPGGDASGDTHTVNQPVSNQLEFVSPHPERRGQLSTGLLIEESYKGSSGAVAVSARPD